MSNTLGSYIRNYRKSKELTLKQLSEKSGLSIPYLSDLERDVVNPSVKTLQMIAPCLDISLPEIVNFNGDLDHRLLTENRRLTRIIDSIRMTLSL